MADLTIIMGATGGLGTAVVDAFAKRGDRIIAVARSRSGVSELAAKYPLSPSASGGGQGGGVTGETADMTSRQDVDDLWERIDRVGVPRWVVNTTGGYRAGKVVDSTPDDFSAMMDLNLGTAWWSCRAAARRMASSPSPSASSPSPLAGEGRGGGSGCIVNVSSRSALVADPGAAAYAIAKAGVIKLTEVLAAELKLSGVRVNVVVPAVIDTAENRKSLPEKLMQKAVAPAEIAAVILYLCSDAAAAITGAAVPVYGKF
ncbi:MAG: SDR family oxidoreductase [Chloroflexi bacterium]|nr:MAG: SDR family oxidoreductase [Chloroflexota bacterium]